MKDELNKFFLRNSVSLQICERTPDQHGDFRGDRPTWCFSFSWRRPRTCNHVGARVGCHLHLGLLAYISNFQISFPNTRAPEDFVRPSDCFHSSETFVIVDRPGVKTNGKRNVWHAPRRNLSAALKYWRGNGNRQNHRSEIKWLTWNPLLSVCFQLTVEKSKTAQIVTARNGITFHLV